MRGAPDCRDTSVERLTPVVRRLVLLRHGETGYNATARMQGQLDTDLSDLGVRQAESVSTVLAAGAPMRIVSSDLRRAADTAAPLARAAGLSVVADSRLRETNLGEWQGLTHHEVDEHMPGARQRWRDDATWAPPQGESRVDVARRIRPVVDELVDDLDEWGGSTAPERPVILVAHGGAIAALTGSLLDLPVAYWHVFGGLTNTGWAQLSGHGAPGARPRWRLDAWNASAGTDTW